MSDKQLMAEIVIKYGTAAAIAASDPVLLKGQPCVETDTGKIKVGDGIKTWTQLAYVNVLPSDSTQTVSFLPELIESPYHDSSPP